jgi:outer membrane protein assembly factor BamB/predicted phosphodiesterase
MKILLFLILFLAHSLNAQEPFSFAHITDTHIGNATGADDLQRTVDDLNAQEGISFALVTGDITEAGFDGEFRIAKRILDGLTIPWYIIPGNHDMKWSGSGGYSFQKIFGYERISFDHQGFRFIGLHQGPVLRMGDGHWSPQDMRWLDSILHYTGKKHPLIIFTHYPVDPGIANWYEALDRLKGYNVKAVVYGHGHRNKFESFEGIAGIMGRSNLRARDSVGGYNIVAMRNDSIIYAERNPLLKLDRNWHAHRLSDYPKSSTTESRPSFALNDSFPDVRARWKYSTGYTIASTPARYKENIIVGDASGKVFSFLISSGKTNWNFQTNGPVYSSPAVDGDRVVFASTDSVIYCLDARTGKQLWNAKTGASVVASPRINDGVVFIGGSDGIFRAIDMKTGKTRWKFEGVNGFVECVPAITDGKVIFGAWDEHLYCLDQLNGTLLWQWNSGRRGVLLSPAACEPVVANGKVFIVAPDRFMTAIDLQTGRTLWRTNQFQVRETIGISADGKRIYVRTMNDSLYAISSEAETSKAVWSLNAGFGYDINSAMIKEKEGIVFYPTKNGLIFGIDGKSGSVLWKHKTGVGVTNTVLPLTGKNFIVTDFDGTVTLIDVKK